MLSQNKNTPMSRTYSTYPVPSINGLPEWTQCALIIIPCKLYSLEQGAHN